MKKEQVSAIILKRLAKKITNKVRKSSDNFDQDNSNDIGLEQLGGNVFNPIRFIIDELKRYQ